MNKIKIAFFDIDGTILRFGKTDLSAKTKEALNSLQQNGVKICIATGRPLITIPKFEGVDFDVTVAFNGSVCKAGEEIILNQTIPSKEVDKIIENATNMGKPLAVATKSCIATNGCDEPLREYLEIAKLEPTPIEEFEDALKEEVYQFMIGCEKSRWDELLEGTKEALIAAWWDCAVDIIPKASGKGKAIKKVAGYFGFSDEEILAFGDGGNDLEMLTQAGTGVAMGNAKDDVKAAADEVCKSVDEDGVYYYLKEKGLI